MINTTPEAVASNDELGPFAYVNPAYLQTRQQGGVMTVTDYPGEVNTVPLYTQAALDAAVAAERERCAKPVPDEWLVKVRRLVEGFEHVSGIARLWEPDYSTGSERALWARATEACADVAKLLAEAKKA